MANWFLVKHKFNKRQEDGSVKKVSEQHLFDGVSYTEVEKRFALNFSDDSEGSDRSITGISPMKLMDIIGDSSKDIWFKVKFHYLSESDSGKIKKVVNTMLVNADTLEESRLTSEKEFDIWTIDCHIDSISETKILEVFPYVSEDETDQADEDSQ